MQWKRRLQNRNIAHAEKGLQSLRTWIYIPVLVVNRVFASAQAPQCVQVQRSS